MESASGADLDEFFKQWLYQGGNILLEGTWKYDDAKKAVEIKLAQVQDDGFTFTFPLELGIYGNEKEVPVVHKVEMDGLKNTYSLSVETKPDRVIIDPNTVLLAQWTFAEMD